MSTLREFQVYGLDAGGTLVHAGVHRLRRMTRRRAIRLQREWERWARQYVADHPGDYPLVHALGQTVTLVAYPVGHPEQHQEFLIQE